MKCLKMVQNIHLHRRRFSKNVRTVLGIETSCDDTAVAIVREDKKILATRRHTERSIQRQQGGINPSVCAIQHRENLPNLIRECVEESEIDPGTLDGVAVTVTPGLVIALKEGISAAIHFAKKNAIPLIPVHHMRAHAVSILLVDNSVHFPFSTLLLSGGHALIAVANGPEDFELYGQSIGGSPGECIDKVARRLGDLGSEFNGFHPGAAVEVLAKRATSHLQYPVFLPSVGGANMNFDQIKGSYLNLIDRIEKQGPVDKENLCASLQDTVSRHIASKLHLFFEYLETTENPPKQLVVGGGVAANKYIYNAISKLSSAHQVSTHSLPMNLCTDNAEMVAYTGLLMLANGSKSIFASDSLPDTIYAHSRSNIGLDCTSKVSVTPRKKLVTSSLFGDQRIRFRNSENFRKMDCDKALS